MLLRLISGYLAFDCVATVLCAAKPLPDSTNFPTMKKCKQCDEWYPVGGKCPKGH